MGFASLLPHRAVTAQQFLICGITGNTGNTAIRQYLICHGMALGITNPKAMRKGADVACNDPVSHNPSHCIYKC